MNQAMECADILSIWPVDLGGICSPKTGRFMWDLDLENRSIYAGPDSRYVFDGLSVRVISRECKATLAGNRERQRKI